MQSSSLSSAIFIESLPLLALRLSLYFACRKYLLRSLYHDLQSLSSDSTGDAIELSSSASGSTGLPMPSVHTPRLGAEDRSLHSSVSRGLFSWCFTESCMLFLLLMFQGMDLFLPSTRLSNWKLSLFALMGCILVLIPLSISLLVALGGNGAPQPRSILRPRTLPSLLILILYLLLLSYIPIPSALSASPLTTTTTTALARLVVLGTTILGLLSGFGAVSSSWPFLMRHQSTPTEQDVDAAVYALSSIRNDLRERKAELERRAGTENESSWISRVGSSFRGGDSLSQELQGLLALEHQMARNVEVLRTRRANARFEGTFRGRLWTWGGRLFAVYCGVRIINSLINIFHSSTSSSNGRDGNTNTYPDLIAYLLVQLFPDSKVDMASYARQLGLVFVGLIILSSIQRVLRGVTRLLRVTSRSLGASLMLLFLAQLMGIYLLSTIVQLRSSFPPPPVTIPSDPSIPDGTPTNLFSTIPEYEVFGKLFDWSFLISVAASAFVRWGAERVNGPGMGDS